MKLQKLLVTRKERCPTADTNVDGITPVGNNNGLTFSAAARKNINNFNSSRNNLQVPQQSLHPLNRQQFQQQQSTQGYSNQNYNGKHQTAPGSRGPGNRRNSALVFGQAKEGDAPEHFSLAAELGFSTTIA